MMKLGGRCIVQTFPPSLTLGVIAPWIRTPKNMALGYDVGKINAGCLVTPLFHLLTVHITATQQGIQRHDEHLQSCSATEIIVIIIVITIIIVLVTLLLLTVTLLCLLLASL